VRGDDRQWTDSQINEHFWEEIQQRFDEENVRWKAQSKEDIEAFRKRNPKAAAELEADPNTKHMMTVQSSDLYQTYRQGRKHNESNLAQFWLPHSRDWGDAQLLDMFRKTEMGWAAPRYVAKMEYGEARLVVEVTLVDSWDDKRHREYLKRQKEKSK